MSADLGMSRMQGGLKRFVCQSRSLQLFLQCGGELAGCAAFVSTSGELGADRSHLGREALFLASFGLGHYPAHRPAPVAQHIEKYPRLGPFREMEGFTGSFHLDQQIDQRIIRSDGSLEEALPVL